MSLVISDQSYAGEAASAFIVKAVVGNEIVQGGHVYVKDGIKKSYTIPRIVASDVVQDRVATPVSNVGALTVDAKVLTPKDYMVYQEFNPRDYEDHWFATQLNATLIDRALPATVESVMIQEVMKRHNKWLGKAIIQGDTTLTSNLKYFDGLLTRAKKAGSTVNKVGSPVVITITNIADCFQNTLTGISEDVLYDPNIKFFVSYKTAQIWEQYQRSSTFKGVDTTQAGIMRFGGRTIVPLAGMTNDTILLAKGSADMESNLWVGMNSIDDASVQIARLQANSELYFIKMLMKVDTNFGFGEEISLYTL